MPKTKRAACGTKQKFEDKAAADRAVASVKRAGASPLIRSYQCKHCGKWHFGHFRPNRQNRRG